MKRLLMLALLATAAALMACDGRTKVIEQVPHATAANELAAMTRLRSIAMAELRYQAESGGKYAPLDELLKSGLLNDPSQGKLNGYRFDVKVKGDGFRATAVPEKFPITGKRSFYIDETNLMHGADRGGAEAAPSDPTV